MEQRHDNPSDELEQLETDAPEALYEVDDEPQAPKLVRIRLNGKTLEITEDQAAIIEEHEAERQRVISRMGTELGQLRRQPQEERPAAQANPQDEDLEFFQSPSKAFQTREQRLREELKREMRAEYEQVQAQQRFWGKFYADNKDLVGQEDVVQFMVNKHMDDIKDLDHAACHQELAKRTKAFLGRSQSGTPLTDRQVTTERSSNSPPTARQRAEETPNRPNYGLGAQLLAKRKEERRRAQFNIKKDPS